MKMVYQGLNSKTNRVEWLDEDAGIIMEEWQAVRYRTLVEDIERRIGRNLTKEETKTIHWLSGWEQSTVNTIRNLINEAYMHGFNGYKLGETTK